MLVWTVRAKGYGSKLRFFPLVGEGKSQGNSGHCDNGDVAFKQVGSNCAMKSCFIPSSNSIGV